MLPIKSTQEGIAKYVGKYIAKGCGDRLEGWEHARLVRYSTRTPWRTSFCNFAWNSDGARMWRNLVREVAAELGVEDMPDMTKKAGRRWAYFLQKYLAEGKAAGLDPTPRELALMINMRARVQAIVEGPRST